MKMNIVKRQYLVFFIHVTMSATAAGCLFAPCIAAQKPPPRNFTLEEFIRASDIIVLGKIESQFWVVDPAKGVVKMTKRPDGNLDIELPLLQNDYVKGIDNNLRVETVLKSDTRIELADLLRIFTEGFARTESPNFLKGERYIVFLTKMAPRDPAYAGTVVIDPSDDSREKGPFDSGVHYSVVGGERGLSQVTAENAGRVDQFLRRIRANVKGSR